MSKLTYYRQCRLQKENSQQMSWIPEEFAEVNKVLKLRNEDGEWDNGWTVTSVGNRLEEHYLPNVNQMIKGHRKNTGDSLPKEKK
jgi:hypothetical protein